MLTDVLTVLFLVVLTLAVHHECHSEAIDHTPDSADMRPNRA